MPVYSVKCGWCRKEMLFEKVKKLEDPGTLPAYCSDYCSMKFGKRLLEPSCANGMGIIIDLPCGCFAAVYGIADNGSTHPWMFCKKGSNYSKHS